MRPKLLPILLLGAAACAPGVYYAGADVIYTEPVEYAYIAPLDRVVVVSREVLVNRGYTVFRVEHARGGRMIWARRGDDDIVQIYAAPSGRHVTLRAVRETRERGNGRHRGWVQQGPPRRIVSAIDTRLRHGRH
jgi:hypothetical protein